MVTIAIIILTVALAACTASLVASFKLFALCSFISKSVPQITQLHTEQLAAIVEAYRKAASLNAASCESASRAATDAARELLSIHADTLANISASHGEAARHFQSAAEAHHLAASASADATTELRRAAEQVNTMLASSNLQEIKQHLHALRNFWVKS